MLFLLYRAGAPEGRPQQGKARGVLPRGAYTCALENPKEGRTDRPINGLRSKCGMHVQRAVPHYNTEQHVKCRAVTRLVPRQDARRHAHTIRNNTCIRTAPTTRSPYNATAHRIVSYRIVSHRNALHRTATHRIASQRRAAPCLALHHLAPRHLAPT